MSAILYVASIATTYHKPSLKRSYKENEFTKFANPNKQKVEALKKEFNSLKFDFIIDKPFFGKGIRNYKYSFNHNDYIERENHLQSRSANGRDIHIYKDENGKKYIYHYSLIERECDYHQYCLIIDGKTYNINQGLTRLELTPGVHKVEFVCDIDIVYGTQTKRLKFNKTQYVYLRDGYNYYSISTDFKEGFIGVHFNSYNHQEYGDSMFDV